MNDPGEDEPELINDATCKKYKEEAESLYLGDSTTPKTSIARSCEGNKYPTINCQPAGPNREMILASDPTAYGEYDADKYSLWTQCE